VIQPDGSTIFHSFPRTRESSAGPGRGLINAQPYFKKRRKLDEGEVDGRKPVVARRNAAIMLDLVEQPLDQVAGTIINPPRPS
jgi:hypothetical protein